MLRRKKPKGQDDQTQLQKRDTALTTKNDKKVKKDSKAKQIKTDKESALIAEIDPTTQSSIGSSAHTNSVNEQQPAGEPPASQPAIQSSLAPEQPGNKVVAETESKQSDKKSLLRGLSGIFKQKTEAEKEQEKLAKEEKARKKKSEEDEKKRQKEEAKKKEDEKKAQEKHQKELKKQQSRIADVAVSAPTLVVTHQEVKTPADTTTAKPSVDTTAAKPSVETTAAKPSVETTAAKPSVETTAAKPSVETTAAKPSVETTAAKPSVETTAAKPSVETTAAKPSFDTPAAKPPAAKSVDAATIQVIEVLPPAPVLRAAPKPPVNTPITPEPIAEKKSKDELIDLPEYDVSATDLSLGGHEEPVKQVPTSQIDELKRRLKESNTSPMSALTSDVCYLEPELLNQIEKITESGVNTFPRLEFRRSLEILAKKIGSELREDHENKLAKDIQTYTLAMLYALNKPEPTKNGDNYEARLKAHQDQQIEALKTFENNCKKTDGWAKTFGKVLLTVLAAAVGCIIGAAVGVGIGYACGALTGPGAIVTSILGGILGVNVGLRAGIYAKSRLFAPSALEQQARNVSQLGTEFVAPNRRM